MAPIPSIEASVIAEKVAPNTQVWRSQAEDLRKENQLLREEIDRLKEVEYEGFHGGPDDTFGNSRRSNRSDARTSNVGTFVVTAYTSGYESTQKHAGEEGYGITASGKPVQANITVACPQELPFGTRVEIEGVGERVCEDRGGAIEGNRLDVYMPELADAREFGRQALKVRIIK